MAFNVSFRVLLFLLAVVVFLNFTQFIINTKRSHKEGSSRYPFAFIDFKARRNNENDSETTNLNDLYYNFTCPLTESNLEVCPEIPFGLGVENNVSEGISKMVLSNWLEMGGAHKPRHCKSRQKIAVIIPFSGKHEELKNFTSHLHYLLIKQEAEYQIFVVEYGNNTIPFNRGHLTNVGFLTVQKQGTNWQCIILHTAHIVPTDSRNLYRCNWYPKQFVGDVESAGDRSMRLDKKTIANGVISLTPKQLYKINGFSNQLFDEDEYYYTDFLKRLQWANYTLERSNEDVSKYKSLEEKLNEAHSPSPPTSKGFPATPPITEILLHRPTDGISGLVYDLYSIDIHGLYTLLRVSRPIKATTSTDMFDLLSTRTMVKSLNDVEN